MIVIPGAASPPTYLPLWLLTGCAALAGIAAITIGIARVAVWPELCLAKDTVTDIVKGNRAEHPTHCFAFGTKNVGFRRRTVN